ncbi:MAG: hypothetical protein ACHQ06_01485 [Candidatus Dormibacteria bacterium]
MPNSLWLFAAATIVVVGLWAALLGRLGYLTSADVRAWRRLAALRGYARPQTRLARAAGRSAIVRRLQEELDLRRLLAQADRTETDAGFLGRTAVVALITFTVTLVVDTTFRLGSGDFAVPPWIAAVLALAAVLAGFALLRAAAQRRRERADRTLGDMMMLVAIVTDGRGLQVEDAVRILSRCATTSDLRTLVDGGWRRLVAARPRSTAELYRSIGEEFRIPGFTLVADALATTNVGIGERITYTRLAQAVYQRRLADARMRAARARILVTLPVAGMLIPLLLLLGAPTFASLTTGLGGG